jgi:hypothetical protein
VVAVLALAAALHAAYTVETNKLGQVVRIRSSEPSRDANFNELTRANALQAFIRRPNGTAVPGVYKLTYDYSPKTQMVRRDVLLVHRGGVDPNAKGAVTVQMQHQRPPAPANLPDFNKIVAPAKP